MANLVFYHWAKGKYLGADNPNGDFVHDMCCDRDFPFLHSKSEKGLEDYHNLVLSYLHNKNACCQAIDVFEELFTEYKGGIKHTYNARSDYYKKWRKEHKEKIAEYNKKYWEKKLEELM